MEWLSGPAAVNSTRIKSQLMSISSNSANVGIQSKEKLPTLSGLFSRSFGSKHPTALASVAKAALTGSEASVSWASDPACYSSWSSRVEASGGSVMTSKAYAYTAILTGSTVSTYGVSNVLTGLTTKSFDAGSVTYQVGDDGVCCGICNVLYRNVIVCNWPAATMNIWCLSDLKIMPTGASGEIAGSASEGSPNSLPTLPDSPFPSIRFPALTVGPDSSAQLTVDPSGPPNSDSTASQLYGSDYNGVPPGGFGVKPQVKPRNAQHALTTQASTLPPDGQFQARTFVPISGAQAQNGSKPSSNPDGMQAKNSKVFAIGSDGFTYVSPTVYVLISTIQAQNNCGTVGSVHTSLTLSFEEH